MKTKALNKWLDGDTNRGVLLTSNTPTTGLHATTFAASAVIVRKNEYIVYDYAHGHGSDEEAYEKLSEKFESEAAGIMQSAEK